MLGDAKLDAIEGDDHRSAPIDEAHKPALSPYADAPVARRRDGRDAILSSASSNQSCDGGHEKLPVGGH